VISSAFFKATVGITYPTQGIVLHSMTKRLCGGKPICEGISKLQLFVKLVIIWWSSIDSWLQGIGAIDLMGDRGRRLRVGAPRGLTSSQALENAGKATGGLWFWSLGYVPGGWRHRSSSLSFRTDWKHYTPKKGISCRPSLYHSRNSTEMKL
jgi:hypothetical protein